MIKIIKQVGPVAWKKLEEKLRRVDRAGRDAEAARENVSLLSYVSLTLSCSFDEKLVFLNGASTSYECAEEEVGVGSNS